MRCKRHILTSFLHSKSIVSDRKLVVLNICGLDAQLIILLISALLILLVARWATKRILTFYTLSIFKLIVNYDHSCPSLVLVAFGTGRLPQHVLILVWHRESVSLKMSCLLLMISDGAVLAHFTNCHSVWSWFLLMNLLAESGGLRSRQSKLLAPLHRVTVIVLGRNS